MQNFFEFFLKKTLFQNHFPIFCNNIIQLRHFLKTGDDAGILVGSAPVRIGERRLF